MSVEKATARTNNAFARVRFTFKIGGGVGGVSSADCPTTAAATVFYGGEGSA